jgi:hypothetical protein
MEDDTGDKQRSSHNKAELKLWEKIKFSNNKTIPEQEYDS